MAQNNKVQTNGLKVPRDAQARIVEYGQAILSARTKDSQLHDKMAAIDEAYARYKKSCSEESTDGVDVRAGSTCCNVFATDDITAPIVVSQVDSMVAYLAEVFLSGVPIFPVVSTPKNRKSAEQLEVLIDDHAMIGGYARQILMSLRDGVKYNIMAAEADWASVDQFSVVSDFASGQSGKSLDKKPKYFTKIKRLDMYNTVFDKNVLPGDIATEGDYAGYIEIISKTKLKRLINKLGNEGTLYNATDATNSIGSNAPGGNQTLNYKVHPQVSDYIMARKPNDEVDWSSYLTDGKLNGAGPSVNMAVNYEKFTFYARIMPRDFGILGPQPGIPQIWKFIIINNSILIHAKRVISAYDVIPILFGQPLEDGLGLQTKSVAEGAIPFQEGASTLFNIRFAAARRSVSDRALYDQDMISSDDVNSATAAPKIPVKINALGGKKLGDAYAQIPFDMRGTETTINDATVLSGFATQLQGLNGPQSGMFQKGNKSVQEWTDTMGNSDNRLRMPAIVLEHQFFMPMKHIIALNIFQFGEDSEIVSQKTGELITINMAELKKQVLSFRIADGYTPKSKMASTDMITAGLTLIGNSPLLQQSYGQMMPSMFAHLMSLGGVRGLEEYDPSYAQGAGQVAAPTPVTAALPGDPAAQNALQQNAASNTQDNTAITG